MPGLAATLIAAAAAVADGTGGATHQSQHRPIQGRYVAVSVGTTECDVTKFGAKGDGKADDTAAIQAAMDHCGAAGGGRVLLPAPHTYLVFSIHFSASHTELHIPSGATLLASNDIDGWRNGTVGSAIIVAQGLQHIAITGGGTVDGQGLPWWLRMHKHCPKTQCVFFRPHTVDFRSVTTAILSDTLYTNNPNHVLELGCDYCELSGVSTLNLPVNATLPDGSCPAVTPASAGCWVTASNTDSVDVHGSPFYIHGANFTSGDDNVAVHANDTLVEDSFFGSGHGASIGSCGEGTYLKNITFRNLTLRSLPRGSGQNGCRIKTDPGVKHAHIWDVTYQDIKMDGVGYTIEVTQNYGGKPGGKNSAASVHSQFLIEDVRFRNIVSTHAGHKKNISNNPPHRSLSYLEQIQADRARVGQGASEEAASEGHSTPVVVLTCDDSLADRANCHNFVLDNVVHVDPVKGANMSCAGVTGSAEQVTGIGPSCLRAPDRDTAKDGGS